jgi:hypothetical protein
MIGGVGKGRFALVSANGTVTVSFYAWSLLFLLRREQMQKSSVSGGTRYGASAFSAVDGDT